MKGIIIKKGDTVYKAAIPNCGVSFAININRYDGAYWSAGGLKMPGEIHVTWTTGETLEVGDEFELEFAEFDEASPTTWEESHQSLLNAASDCEEDSPEMWQRMLDKYYDMKKILEDENLIEKE